MHQRSSGLDSIPTDVVAVVEKLPVISRVSDENGIQLHKSYATKLWVVVCPYERTLLRLLKKQIGTNTGELSDQDQMCSVKLQQYVAFCALIRWVLITINMAPRKRTKKKNVLQFVVTNKRVCNY